MKKVLLTALLVVAGALCGNATVLFPFFVDIAPNYEKGNAEEFKDIETEAIMYHSTTPGFWPKTYSQLKDFITDTLPSDATMEERIVGDKKLLVISSVHKKNDTIDTGDTIYTIYVLELPGDSFRAVYSECHKEE